MDKNERKLGKFDFVAKSSNDTSSYILENHNRELDGYKLYGSFSNGRFVYKDDGNVKRGDLYYANTGMEDSYVICQFLKEEIGKNDGASLRTKANEIEIESKIITDKIKRSDEETFVVEVAIERGSGIEKEMAITNFKEVEPGDVVLLSIEKDGEPFPTQIDGLIDFVHLNFIEAVVVKKTKNSKTVLCDEKINVVRSILRNSREEAKVDLMKEQVELNKEFNKKINERTNPGPIPKGVIARKMSGDVKFLQDLCFKLGDEEEDFRHKKSIIKVRRMKRIFS